MAALTGSQLMTMVVAGGTIGGLLGWAVQMIEEWIKEQK